MLSLQNRITVNSLGGLTGLAKIVSNYGFLNFWDTESLTISGTTTTYIDRLGVHNLPNPAAANQATYSASDSDFNNKPSLDYDGTTDYNYKAFNNYRGGDSDGAFYFVFKTGATLSATHPIISFSDESTNNEKLLIFTDSAQKLGCLLNNGANIYSQATTTTLATNTVYVGKIESNGSTYKISINNVDQTINMVFGVNNGNWFNSLTTLTNISIGARINTSSIYSNAKIVCVGYSPLQSGVNDAALITSLGAYYGKTI